MSIAVIICWALKAIVVAGCMWAGDGVKGAIIIGLAPKILPSVATSVNNFSKSFKKKNINHGKTNWLRFDGIFQPNFKKPKK